MGYGAFKRDMDAERRIVEERRAEQTRREAEEKEKQEEEEKARIEAELETLPEVDKLVRKIELASTNEEGEMFVNTVCLSKLDELEGEDQKKLALAIKGFYERIRKWKVKKQKKKQYAKVQKIKKILGESE